MIYELTCAEGYEWINTVLDADYEKFWALNGLSVRSTWCPIAVRFVCTDEDQPNVRSDFPWLSGSTLVMRSSAAKQLHDIWEANGELLPLLTRDNVQLYAFNCRALDALDETRSSIKLFPETNRIMHIGKAFFLTNVVYDVDVFRLPYRASPTFVSERFKSRYENAGLVGLRFLQADRRRSMIGK